MRTPHDQVVILYQALMGSAVKDQVGGRIYTYDQPVTPDLESVVINALPVNADQFQQGTANVNIYVPDLDVLISGQPVRVPSAARLNELTRLVGDQLTEIYTAEYRFNNALFSGFIAVPETRQHYVNLRIDFLFFPL